MFYLTNFFKVLIDQKFKGLAFIVLSFALCFSLLRRDEVKKIFSFSQKIIQKPYFNALLPSSREASIIASRLERLPGVEEVKLIKHNIDPKKINAVGANLSAEVLNSVLGQDYQTIKVVLEKDLEVRSQSLIKEYLGRLVGDRDVTISEIKTPGKIEINQNDPSFFIDNYGDLYVAIILSVLWLFSCFGIISYIQVNSYLIEKFQRKKDVAMKTFLSGVCVLFTPAIIYFASLGNFPLKEIAVLAIILCVSIMFSKKRVSFQRAV